MRLLLAAISLVLLVSACSSPSQHSDPKWVEYGIAVDEQVGAAQSSIAYPYFGGGHLATEQVEVVTPVQRCRVASALLSQDRIGYPAVLVSLDARDAHQFEEFTGANVNRQLVIIVDGRVASKATILEKLPGEFQVYGKFSKDETQQLLKALQ